MESKRTLVVEDEGLSRRRLEKMVAAHKDLDLISDSARSGEEALIRIKGLKPDLILLDIELKDANAFEILEQTGKIESKVIFITACNNYAVKAFEFDAVDYILKPFSASRFEKAIQRYFHKIGETKGGSNLQTNLVQTETNSKLKISEGNTIHFLDSQQIEYVTSQGYYVNFVMATQEILIRTSLKTLEKDLPLNFSRINKSTIINRNHIKVLVRNKNSLKVVMKDQNEFSVTENYRANMKDF